MKAHFTLLFVFFISITLFSQNSQITVTVATPDIHFLEGAIVNGQPTDADGKVTLDVTPPFPKTVSLYIEYEDEPSKCITIDDATLLNQYLLGMRTLDQYQIFASDVNCTESISASDYSSIERIIAYDKFEFPCKQWGFFGSQQANPSLEIFVAAPNVSIEYSVIAIKKGNVDHDYSCFATSNKNQAVETLNFFPNPAQDHIVVDHGDIHEVEVVSLDGRVQNLNVVKGKVNVSHLITGSYLIRSQNAENTFVARLIKL